MDNTSTESHVLVVGATGFLGMEICRQLRVKGQNVTALIRKTSAAENVSTLKQQGMHFAEADLKDAQSIKKALMGITTVISTASTTRSRQTDDSIQTVDNEGQANLVDEAKAAGVKQFIFISFTFTPEDFPLQTAKRRVEETLKASGMNYTFIKPSFFMEAWLSPAIGFDFPNAKATIYGDGKNKISWINISDVAAFTVAAIDNPAAYNKTIEIGGPEALSPLEVVSIFEKAGTKKFEIQHVPVEALQAQKNEAPDDLSKSFASLMLFYAEGNEVRTPDLHGFPVAVNSVRDYANRVMVIQPV